MDRLTCDRCGEGLLLDAPVRYEVSIEVKSAYDPLELVEEDLVDAADEMKRLIAKLQTVSPDEAQDEVYRKFRFDLCRTCQKVYLKDPIPKREPGPRNPEPEPGA